MARATKEEGEHMLEEVKKSTKIEEMFKAVDTNKDFVVSDITELESGNPDTRVVELCINYEKLKRRIIKQKNVQYSTWSHGYILTFLFWGKFSSGTLYRKGRYHSILTIYPYGYDKELEKRTGRNYKTEQDNLVNEVIQMIKEIKKS